MSPLLGREKQNAPGERMTVFWDVDTQIDFMVPGGKLYVAGAEQIVPNLKALTEWARKHATLVISSACAHQEGDPEFQLYPRHCLVGTRGQEKIPETLLPDRLLLPPHHVALPKRELRLFEQVILEKRSFDVFTNANTDAVLDQLGPGLDIVLYGVVTEICVAAAARGLMERHHHVQVVTDAVRAIDERKAQTLFEEILQRDGKLVTTAEILAQKEREVPHLQL